MQKPIREHTAVDNWLITCSVPGARGSAERADLVRNVAGSVSPRDLVWLASAAGGTTTHLELQRRLVGFADGELPQLGAYEARLVATSVLRLLLEQPHAASAAASLLVLAASRGGWSCALADMESSARIAYWREAGLSRRSLLTISQDVPDATTCLAEEVNLLWWSGSEYSVSARKPWAEVNDLVRPLVAALDLHAYTAKLPGVRSAASLLNRHAPIAQSPLASTNVLAMARDHGIEVPTPEPALVPYTPFLSARSDGALEFHAKEVGMQCYLELMLITAMT